MNEDRKKTSEPGKKGFVLAWVTGSGDDRTQVTPDNAAQCNVATAEFGIFHLFVSHNNRRCKDNAKEYMVHIYVPAAASNSWFTLVRVRGTMLDAISEAEYKLFHDRTYRLPPADAPTPF